MKSFVLVFNYSVLPRQEMLDFLETIPDIVRNWRALEMAIFLASEHSAAEIGKRIHEKFPTLRYFLTEITTSNKQGWLDRETWDRINDPKPVN